MKNKNYLWIIILLIVIILILGTNTLSFGRRTWMQSGYGMMGPGMMGPGMMGPGMMGVGLIIPIIIIIFVIATGVWLGNFLSSRGQHYHSAKENSCPNCSKQIESDWKTCPYCSEKLK